MLDTVTNLYYFYDNTIYNLYKSAEYITSVTSIIRYTTQVIVGVLQRFHTIYQSHI